LGEEPRFFHMIKSHRHCRVTLIMKKKNRIGENPLVLCHYSRHLMYRRPKVIKLDAATMRPNSL